MPVKVAINGFGRIGRNVLRAIVESGRRHIEVVAINDLGSVETNAHLLRFDSIHGRFPYKVTVAGSTIDVGRGPIEVTSSRDPAMLPHAALDVDIALECTKAVGLVLPELNGRLDGVAIRVSTPNVSVVDFKFIAKRATSSAEVNASIKEAANGRLKDILGYTDEPNVSVDFNHDSRSSIFHTDQTKVIDGTFVRVMSWYDNEWGFSSRMSDTAVAMGRLL